MSPKKEHPHGGPPGKKPKPKPVPVPEPTPVPEPEPEPEPEPPVQRSVRVDLPYSWRGADDETS